MGTFQHHPVACQGLNEELSVVWDAIGGKVLQGDKGVAWIVHRMVNNQTVWRMSVIG